MANNKFTLASPVALGGVEAAKQLYQGNKLFSAEDWNTFVRSGEVQNYITMLNEFSKGNRADEFIGSYSGDLSKLTPEQRMTAMANELYGDRLTPVTKKITKDDGTEEEYQITEYEYNRKLIENQLKIEDYYALQKQKQDVLDSLSFWEKVGNDFKVAGYGAAKGIVEELGDFSRLMEGIGNVMAFPAMSDEEKLLRGYYTDDQTPRDKVDIELDAWGKAFRKPFENTTYWDDQAVNWLKDSVFKFEEEDLSKGIARYFYSAGDSFGRMVPSMVLNGLGAASSGAKGATAVAGAAGEIGSTATVAKGLAGAAQVVYYSSMAANNMKEMFNDPNIATRPTLEIVANSSLRAAAEYAVEQALGKVLDNTTNLDQITFGRNAITRKSVGWKSAAGKILKDAFQEGAEEVLQDFSGNLINSVFSLWANEYEETTNWSAQGVVDAFILGAVMSLAGGAIKWATTSRVDSGIVATDKKGNILYNKDGSVKTKKYSKLTSMGIVDNLTQMYSMFEEVASDETLSTKERTEAMFQAYTAARVIGDLYGEYGQARFDTALDILQKAAKNDFQAVDADTSTTLNAAQSAITEAIALAQKDYSDARIKKISETIKAQNNASAHVITNQQTAEEIVDTTGMSKEEAEAIQNLLDASGAKEAVITDKGAGIVGTNTDTIIAGRQDLTSFSGDTNLRVIAEQRIAMDMASSKELTETLKEIHEVAKSLGGEDTTMEQAIFRLLYDTTFQQILLYNNDKTLLSIIAHLDKMYAAVKLEGKDRKRLNAIQKHQIEIIRNNISEALFNYFLGNDQVTIAYVESLDILSAEQKRQLRANNWQNGIYAKITIDKELPNDSDLRLLDIRTRNALMMKKTQRDEIHGLIHSGDIIKVEKGIRQLNAYYRSAFEGRYNNVEYLRYDGRLSTSTFNSFLFQYGLTIQTIANMPTDQGLVQDIQSTTGGIDQGNVIEYWQSVFKNNYGYTFTLSKVKGSDLYIVTVKEGKARVETTSRKDLQARKVQAENIDVPARTMLIKASTGVKYPIFHESINEVEQAIYTIDDVVKDPSLLSEDIKKQIYDKSGDLSTKSVYLFLRDYYLDKSNGKESIVVDENGDYYVASVDTESKMLKQAEFGKLYKTMSEARTKMDKFNSDDEIDVSEEFEKTITKKYGTALGDIPSLVLTPMTNTSAKGAVATDIETIAYYDAVSNTIFLNANYPNFDEKHVKFNILHELRHAIQKHNGMAMGFDDAWIDKVASKNKAAAKAIISDLRKHFPKVFGRKENDFSTDLELAGDVLYMLSSGEADAYGYAENFYDYPFIVRRNYNGEITEILTPWGSKYDLSGVDTGVTSSKALSMTAKGIFLQIPGTDLPADIQAIYDAEPRLEQLGAKATSKVSQSKGEHMDAAAIKKQQIRDLKEVRSQYGLKYTDQDIELSFENSPEGYRRKWYINTRPDVKYSTFENGYALTVRQITRTDGTAIGEFVPLNFDIAYATAASKEFKRNERVYMQPVIVKTSDVSFDKDGTMHAKKILAYGSAPVLVQNSPVQFETAMILSSDKYADFRKKVYDKVTADGGSYDSMVDLTRRFANEIDQDTIEDIRKGKQLSEGEMKMFVDKSVSAMIKKAFKVKSLADAKVKTWYGLTYDQFRDRATQYVNALVTCDTNSELYTYMWNSGYMSASDNRFKSAKESLINFLNKNSPEAKKLKKAMSIVAWIQTAPMVSYETFLEMDIPFIRISSKTEKIDTGFNGVTLGPNNGKVQEGLAKDHPNKVAKLYVGTVKGKELVGATTSSESEGLVPSKIVQASTVYTVKLDPKQGLMLLDSNRSDFDRQLLGTLMINPDNIDVDRTFSFAKDLGKRDFETNTSRIVTNRVAEGTNLRYYVGYKGSDKPSKIQMSPDMQRFIVATTNIEESLDPLLVKMIHNGELRTNTDILRFLETIDDSTYNVEKDELNNTIRLLAKYYYKNEYLANTDKVGRFMLKYREHNAASIATAIANTVRILNSDDISKALPKNFVRMISGTKLFKVSDFENLLKKIPAKYRQFFDTRVLTTKFAREKLNYVMEFFANISKAPDLPAEVKSLFSFYRTEYDFYEDKSETGSKKQDFENKEIVTIDPYYMMARLLENFDGSLQSIATAAYKSRTNAGIELTRKLIGANIDDTVYTGSSKHEGDDSMPHYEGSTEDVYFDDESSYDREDLDDLDDQSQTQTAASYSAANTKLQQRNTYIAKKLQENMSPKELQQFAKTHANIGITYDGKRLSISFSPPSSLKDISKRIVSDRQVTITNLANFLKETASKANVDFKEVTKGKSTYYTIDGKRIFKKEDFVYYAKQVIDKLDIDDIDIFVRNFSDIAQKVAKVPLDGQDAFVKILGSANTAERAMYIYEKRAAINEALEQAYEDYKAAKKGKKTVTEQRAEIKAAQQARVSSLEQKLASQAQRIKSLEKDIKQSATEIEAAKTRTQRVMQLGDVKFVSSADVGVPDKLKPLLRPIFDKEARTQIKYLSGEDEMHPVRSYEEFVKNYADELASITEEDVDPILNFLANVSVSIEADAEAYISYQALRQFMLLHMYKLDKDGDGMLTLTDNQRARIENMYKTIKSQSGTSLRISQIAEEVIRPTAILAASLKRQLGNIFDEEDLNDLAEIANRDYYATYNATTADEKANADKIKLQNLEAMQQKMLKKALERKKATPSNVVDTLWKWQRLMMLSAPGTWIRNITSNVMVRTTNYISDKVADWTFKLVDRKAKKAVPADQYRLVNTKATDDVKAFIKNQVIDSGFTKLIGEGLLKQDVGVYQRKGMKANSIVASLIARGISDQIYRESTFTDNGKNVFAKMGNSLSKLLYGWTDDNGKTHTGVLSDSVFVNKAFVDYLGKMLTEDIAAGRINLDEGLNSKAVLETVANAYVMASWDYMHKTNFFNDVENLMREKLGSGAFYIWKQFVPFASAGWNWFTKALDYTPYGLVKGILEYAKLEKTIDKMKVERAGIGEKVILSDGTIAEGKGRIAPSERFAYYLSRRRIGSGIIGTIGCIAGVVLAAFGLAGIDDDDGKPKLFVGNMSIDISNVFGTSGMLVGIACVSAIQKSVKKEDNFFDATLKVISAMFNQLFEDSVFSDMLDTLQGNSTIADVIVNKIADIPATFVPNLLRSTLNYATPVRPQYNSGILGMLERILVAMLPVTVYFFPKRYDPYTGELQYKYNMPWNEGFGGAVLSILGTLTNYSTPVKISRRTVSENERVALANNVSKGELSGNYKDIGKLNNKNKDALNEYYGLLNDKTLEQFYNNKKKFVVEDEKGKRVELTYSAMTTKQRKSVIERIMNNNAKIAKIYVGTSKLGYKYYTKSEDEYNTLRSLGIKGVIYSDTHLEGFSK